MKVICRTNLDLFNEQWPTDLPAVPRIGDRIQSATVHGKFHLELEVIKITWVKGHLQNKDEWYPEIELHMNSWHRNLPSKEGAGKGSIAAFYEWYAPLVGKTVSYFF